MWGERGWRKCFGLVYGDGVGMALKCRCCELYGRASFQVSGRERSWERIDCMKYGPRLAKTMMNFGRRCAQFPGMVGIDEGW